MASDAETAASQQHLPFFVYGTLMCGFKNHDAVVRGRHTSAVRATLPAHAVFHYSAGWPGMYPSTGDAGAAAPAVVVGELLTFSADDFPAVLAEMDGLEGAGRQA